MQYMYIGLTVYFTYWPLGEIKMALSFRQKYISLYRELSQHFPYTSSFSLTNVSQGVPLGASALVLKTLLLRNKCRVSMLSHYICHLECLSFEIKLFPLTRWLKCRARILPRNVKVLAVFPLHNHCVISDLFPPSLSAPLMSQNQAVVVHLEDQLT